jgi:hypothetical protein
MSSPPKNQSKLVDFLIITALPVELKAVIDLLKDVRKEQVHGSPTYYRA